MGGGLAQAFGQPAEFPGAEAAAGHAEHRARPFDFLARAMDGVRASAMMQKGQRALD